MRIRGLRSIGGVLLAALGYLAQPAVFNILPEKVGAVVTAVGAVLAVFGLRFAGDKDRAAAGH